MTPNEYRKKHKRCRTCMYYSINCRTFNYDEICTVKNAKTKENKGRFCRVYKAKEFEE